MTKLTNYQWERLDKDIDFMYQHGFFTRREYEKHRNRLKDIKSEHYVSNKIVPYKPKKHKIIPVGAGKKL